MFQRRCSRIRCRGTIARPRRWPWAGIAFRSVEPYRLLATTMPARAPGTTSGDCADCACSHEVVRVVEVERVGVEGLVASGRILAGDDGVVCRGPTPTRPTPKGRCRGARKEVREQDSRPVGQAVARRQPQVPAKAGHGTGHRGAAPKDAVRGRRSAVGPPFRRQSAGSTATSPRSELAM